MIAKGVAVNAVAVLVLAVMSYVLAALILRGLAAFDAWMDPSRKLSGWPLPARKESRFRFEVRRDRIGDGER